MQQLVYISPGTLELRDAPLPRLRWDAGALVRPIAVATCDLDAAIVRGRTPWQGPMPLGHECVAEVVEVGDGVRAVAPGDRVSVPYQVSCGACGPCRAGLTAHCTGHGEPGDGPQVYGWSETSRTWGGFLSDLVHVPFADHMLVAIPDSVDPAAVASLSDNIVDGWRAVARPLAERPGAPVLVVGGSGSIGLYAVAAATGLGAERVVYVDRSRRRLATAAAYGAEVIAVEEEWPDRLGPFPITVDANSTRPGLLLALRSTEPAGVCTSTGMHFGATELPLYDLYLQNITLKIGLIQARADMPAVLDAIGRGVLDPAPVVDAVVDWDDAPAALPEVRQKLVFVRDGLGQSGRRAEKQNCVTEP